MQQEAVAGHGTGRRRRRRPRREGATASAGGGGRAGQARALVSLAWELGRLGMGGRIWSLRAPA